MAACGENCMVLVDEHGVAWSFGRRGPHLGLGTDMHQLLPARLGGRDVFGTLVVLTATHTGHAAAVAADGSLHTWGDGAYGQLGLGDREPRQRPVRIGIHLFGESRAVLVACGLRHTAVLTAVGGVFTCGEGRDGKLGHGDEAPRLLLTQVAVEHFKGVRIVMVAVGVLHSATVGEDGSVCTWGNGGDGCLGHNDYAQRLVPTQLAGMGGVRVVMLATNYFHAAAVAHDGAFWVWGFGRFGQLGLGDTDNRLVPTRVAPEEFGGSPVLTAACGSGHTLVATEDGGMYSCGEGMWGRLGHNDNDNRHVFERVTALANVVSVSAGVCQSSAVTGDGTLFTWGSGWSLGHGDTDERLAPTMVAPRLLGGARVGRCHGLRPDFALAFAMGTHPRLGAAGPRRQSRRQQGQVPAATDGCVYEEMPGELVQRVVDACVSWPEGRAGELEGVVRLLGGGISKLRVSA